MSALYAMQYHGLPNTGGSGALYVGKGIIAGIDVGGQRYKGTYTESEGRLNAKVTLTTTSTAYLVTGQQVPPGTDIPLEADWPINFANGQAQRVKVAGLDVWVSFQKISDIP